MNDREHEETSEDSEDATEKPFGWWRRFHGLPVLIQLRPPLKFILVTAPNEPIEHKGDRVAEAVSDQGHPFLAVPVINGVLEVEGVSELDFRLVVVMRDPNPNVSAMVRTVVHPDDAAFVTVVEQNLIRQA